MKAVYNLTIHRDPRYLLNRDHEEVSQGRVNWEIASFFSKEKLPTADYTVTATFDGVRVGFFRMAAATFDGVCRANALGTYVHPDHRRRGLATLMWKHAIESLGIKKMYVVATSYAGAAFLRSIASSDLGDVFLDLKISGVLDNGLSFC